MILELLKGPPLDAPSFQPVDCHQEAEWKFGTEARMVAGGLLVLSHFPMRDILGLDRFCHDYRYVPMILLDPVREALCQVYLRPERRTHPRAEAVRLGA